MHDNGLVLCGGASTATGRWGDHEANVADVPGSNQNFTWFFGQNTIGGGAWGTCVGRVGYTKLNQP
ncbi:MAG TPA: hypothetical protein VJP02_22520 [Candidatus Sulfotelmatobacter sp.]|nr:hypothetical protein [Candidatus Sulfotelmatobacter sp.]